MRRYSEAVKADVRRRMSPPQRQSVAQISEGLAALAHDIRGLLALLGWREPAQALNSA